MTETQKSIKDVNEQLALLQKDMAAYSYKVFNDDVHLHLVNQIARLAGLMQEIIELVDQEEWEDVPCEKIESLSGFTERGK